MARAVQLNLGGSVNRKDKKARPPRRPEKALQQQTRATLSNLGYASMETGTGRPRVCCPNCQHSFTPTGFMGNTPGLPDLVVMRYAAGWPLYTSLLIEMKGDDTKITPEQQRLADAGRSTIARSIGDAIEGVLVAEKAMDAYRLDPAKRNQLERFLRENEGHLW